MSEMVERVALIFCGGTTKCTCFPHGSPDEIYSQIDGTQCAKAVKLARAAIEAMREPTEAMAAARAKANIGDIWSDMIDAALKAPAAPSHLTATAANKSAPPRQQPPEQSD